MASENPPSDAPAAFDMAIELLTKQRDYLLGRVVLAALVAGGS